MPCRKTSILCTTQNKIYKIKSKGRMDWGYLRNRFLSLSTVNKNKKNWPGNVFVLPLATQCVKKFACLKCKELN